jgi:hypothetical protein
VVIGFIYRHRILTTHQYTSTINAATAAAAASPMLRSIGASFAVKVAASGASLTLTELLDMVAVCDVNIEGSFLDEYFRLLQAELLKMKSISLHGEIDNNHNPEMGGVITHLKGRSGPVLAGIRRASTKKGLQQVHNSTCKPIHNAKER